MFYTPASFVSVFLCHPERALRSQRKGRTQDRRTAAGKESCVTYVSSVHCFLLFVLRLIVSFDFFLFLSLHFFPFVTLFFRALFVFVFFCLFYLFVCVVHVTFILHPSFTSSFILSSFCINLLFLYFYNSYFRLRYFRLSLYLLFYRLHYFYSHYSILSFPSFFYYHLHYFHSSLRRFTSLSYIPASLFIVCITRSLPFVLLWSGSVACKTAYLIRSERT